jgi:hypothetical protein
MSHPFSRNGRCPCGSGRKYKRCCLQHEHAFPTTFTFEVTSSPHAPAGHAALMARKRALMEQWLDEKNGNLGGLTPREAARKSFWRQALSNELGQLQKMEDTIVHPSARMDLSFLWDVLEIEHPPATARDN